MNKMSKESVVKIIATQFWRMFNEYEADGGDSMDEPNSDILAEAALSTLEELGLIVFENKLQTIVEKLSEKGTAVSFEPKNSGESSIGLNYSFEELPKDMQLFLNQNIT